MSTLIIPTTTALIDLRSWAIPGAIAVPSFRVMVYTIDDSNTLVKPEGEDPQKYYTAVQEVVGLVGEHEDQLRIVFVTCDYRLTLVKYVPDEIRERYWDLVREMEIIVHRESGLLCTPVTVATKDELLVGLESIGAERHR
ncbi:hypothetical protein ABW20_dc0110210 [Dactylellina cionopaga]|nr:hypothetical protein ABW20_dc0110210 [Dactylellina cionopaga]